MGNFRRSQLWDQIGILSQRMAGQIHAGDFLFQIQPLHKRKVLHIRKNIFLPGGTGHGVEKSQLPVKIFLFDCVQAAGNRLISRQQLAAVGVHAVKSAAFDQALHRPPVEIPAMHPLAKVIEVLKRGRLPLPDHISNHAASQILDGQKAKTDPLI